MKEKVFELYNEGPHVYEYNANEPMRNGSRGTNESFDQEFDEIPEQFQYNENI